MEGMQEKDEREVLIPEVLPPSTESRGPGEPGPEPSRARQAERIFGPLIGGAIIDGIDFVLWGIPGLVVGGLVAFWISGIFRLPLWQRVLCAIAAAYYCAIPFTRFIPLATLIGAYAQFREKKNVSG